jgi:hypothetical protein
LTTPSKTCNGRFWMLPYEEGCKRRKGREFLGNVGFSTFNPSACPFVRNPSANRQQTVRKPFTATELCVQNLPRTTC